MLTYVHHNTSNHSGRDYGVLFTISSCPIVVPSSYEGGCTCVCVCRLRETVLVFVSYMFIYEASRKFLWQQHSIQLKITLTACIEFMSSCDNLLNDLRRFCVLHLKRIKIINQKKNSLLFLLLTGRSCNSSPNV